MWKTLVAERDKDVLEDAMVVNNNQLVLIYLQDVKVMGVDSIHYSNTQCLTDTHIVCDGIA